MISSSKLTRQNIRDSINKMVGLTINVTDFYNKPVAANYLGSLCYSEHLERISRGEYKVLKKVILKKPGPRKGKRYNRNFKDLSVIPSILNSSKEGLTVSQIHRLYQRITNPEKQVNMLYLYRILGFGITNGVILENGFNEKERRSVRGPTPKRLILSNKNITIEEWESFISEFRLFYQYKKENKVRKKSSRKTIMEKFKNSQSIITNFDEDRDNLNKQFIEEYFIEKVQNHLDGNSINCFAITGPDYNRHVTKLFSTIANKVMICELKPDVFDIIYRKAQICPYYIDNKVSVLNCDVDDVSPINYHYIDVDLMRSLDNISKSVLRQIRQQDYSCDKNSFKFITFTASIRHDGGVDNRLTILKNLLYKGFELKLDSFQNGEGFGTGIEVFNPSRKKNSCLLHISNIKEFGRVKDLYVFTYQDGSPMMSVLVIYK